MKKPVIRYTQEFRQMAVERMKTSPSITALAKELGVPRERLYRWRERLEADAGRPARATKPKNAEEMRLQQQLRQTQQVLAEKTLEVDFLKGALQRVEARRQQNSKTGAMLSTEKSGR